MDWSTSETLPVTDVKQRLLELMKKIELYREVITITRNGVPKGILIGVREFESLVETLEILSDRKVMRSLERSRKQSRKGKLFTDDEVWS